MAISYSRDTSVKEGLAKTFDGEHPCKLCKLIAEAKKSGKKQEAQFELSKIDLFSFPQVRFILNPPPASGFVPAGPGFLDRTETPPTPPPRGFLV